MPKKQPESFNYLSNDPEFVPDPEIEEFMEQEIAHAPKDPDYKPSHAARCCSEGSTSHVACRLQMMRSGPPAVSEWNK